MNIPTAKAKLFHLIRAGLQVLLVGPPGIGKTAIVKQAAAELRHNLIISHPVVSDPTDYKGLPFLIDGGDAAAFMPIGQLKQLIEATEPTLWFIDDLGQAPPTVQAALMQLVHRDSRQLGQHKISDSVRIVAATNRADDGAMVRGMITPLRSRFQLILNVEPCLDAWIPYALAKKIDPRIIAFLKWQQHLGNDDRFYLPNNDMADISQTCCPRTWAESVSDLLAIEDAVFTEPADRLELLSAAIGEIVGLEFCAFLTAAANMVSIADILASPTSAPVPEELDMLYMTVSGLAHRAITHDDGADDMQPISEYLMRVSGELRELFRFTVKQSGKQDLIKTRGYTRLAANSAV